MNYCNFCKHFIRQIEEIICKNFNFGCCENIHICRPITAPAIDERNALQGPLYRARKSGRTLQNKVRIKVFPEQLNLFINTFDVLKQCITQ